MFVADVKCSQAMWQTVFVWRAEPFWVVIQVADAVTALPTSSANPNTLPDDVEFTEFDRLHIGQPASAVVSTLND